MAPRDVVPKTYSSRDKDSEELTTVYKTPDGAPYVICKSPEPFVNPTSPADVNPEEVNEELNQDVGQGIITRRNRAVMWMVNFLDKAVFSWLEDAMFKVIGDILPISLKRGVVFFAWKIYFFLHKNILGKRTGLHPTQSYEYHAMTTVLYWSRLMAVTPKRMRFGLSQLYVVTPNSPPKAERVRQIDEQPDFLKDVPKEQVGHSNVDGWYIHRRPGRTSDKIIFWIYGGAYLSGDVRGNSSGADWLGEQTGMDVFIPSFRLAPESVLDEVLWDVLLAYKWLAAQVQDPSRQIIMLGISSGGALATMVMQMIASQSRGEDVFAPEYCKPLLKELAMPNGCVLFGPYVDYDEEKKGSFKHYPRHDLIVTESVQQHGLPHLGPFMSRPGLENPRYEYSPINRSMQGLPPLCVVVSEHEAVYDMTMDLVNRGRSEGVEVTVGVWKYMCHVFSFLQGLVPEGKISMDFVVEWVKEQAEDNI